ncbi:hypothetical protein ACWT_3056 [Actinoplanes sp. SE50]|uniref:DUF6069 family protein n=1 Tax=unclassified Actinoplanes TaxID=2626549 RepID=UPI00023EC0D6|nr:MULTISPECIES: DUF6069 family protein [unclassified Actinoplanes]AEV84079.1 hypothetical protein ACPL_3184 [Actinoplanes sp. SE50/110]ATO82471.1 hypothetical protein ACWT_3056 [Actinoplanes sp. SE50]SLL99878.1 hypothetical protein ACSP50_3110 [Actinoplanes sp. SE50/110]
MTNQTHRPATATDADCPRPARRRAGRAITVAAGAAGALLLWTVTDPWGGTDLTVRSSGGTTHIGPAAVVITALLAGLAAWALLTVLERRTRHATRTYRIIAFVVLLLSLAGPLGSAVGATGTLTLIGMHTTVGLALILGLPGRRGC